MTDVVVVANEHFRFASVNPLDLAELLSRAGLEVVVAAPFAADAETWNAQRGFRIERLEHRTNLRFWKESVELIRALRPPVTVGVNPVGLVAADLARSVRATRRVVYYALELALPSETPRSMSVRWQSLRAASADRVISTGRERAVVMMERLGLRELPDVIANSPLSSSAVDPAEASQGLRLATGAQGPIAVYAGSLGAPNRILELIEASRRWQSATHLAIHGFGGSPADRDAFERAVAAAPRASSLPSIAGSRDTLIRWLSGADIGCAFLDPRVDPTLNVRFYTPNKLFDYFAAGLAVVVSDNANLRYDVELAGLGRSVDPSDPDAIAAAVDALSKDLDVRARVREAFRNTHAYDVQAARTVRAIEALVRTGW